MFKNMEMNPLSQNYYLTKDEEALVFPKDNLEFFYSIGVTWYHTGEHL